MKHNKSLLYLVFLALVIIGQSVFAMKVAGDSKLTITEERSPLPKFRTVEGQEYAIMKATFYSDGTKQMILLGKDRSMTQMSYGNNPKGVWVADWLKKSGELNSIDYSKMVKQRYQLNKILIRDGFLKIIGVKYIKGKGYLAEFTDATGKPHKLQIQ